MWSRQFTFVGHLKPAPQSNHTEKSYIEQAEMSSQHVDES